MQKRVLKVSGFANRYGGRESRAHKIDRRGTNKRPKFKIKLSNDLQFYWVLLAPNGQVLLISETYTRKHNCNKSALSSKKHVHGLYVTGGGMQFYHVRQQAGNGNILGSSETYFNRRGAARALETMKKYIKIAEIIDTTKK